MKNEENMNGERVLQIRMSSTYYELDWLWDAVFTGLNKFCETKAEVDDTYLNGDSGIAGKTQ